MGFIARCMYDIRDGPVVDGQSTMLTFSMTTYTFRRVSRRTLLQTKMADSSEDKAHVLCRVELVETPRGGGNLRDES